MALRDGRVTPETYHHRPWESPDILDAMSRMTLVVDEGWSVKLDEKGMLGAEIEAEDIGGSRYEAQIEQFRGHPDNPMARDERIAKLEAFVGRSGFLGPRAGSRLLDRCNALVDGGDVNALVDLWRLPAVTDRETGGQAATYSL